jgi:hypothetical protein
MAEMNQSEVLILCERRTRRRPSRKTASPSAEGTAVSLRPRLESTWQVDSSLGKRTYRTRKDQYARSLENEVARLRTVETNLVRETQSLRATIQTLGNCLAKYGIDMPTGLGGDEGMSAPDATFTGRHPSDSSHKGKGAQLDVPLHFGAAPSLVIPTASFPGASHSVRPGPLQDNYVLPALPHRNAPSGQLQFPAIPVTSRHRSARLGDLDPTTVGMEFVLA